MVGCGPQINSTVAPPPHEVEAWKDDGSGPPSRISFIVVNGNLSGILQTYEITTHYIEIRYSVDHNLRLDKAVADLTLLRGPEPTGSVQDSPNEQFTWTKLSGWSGENKVPAFLNGFQPDAEYDELIRLWHESKKQ